MSDPDVRSPEPTHPLHNPRQRAQRWQLVPVAVLGLLALPWLPDFFEAYPFGPELTVSVFDFEPLQADFWLFAFSALLLQAIREAWWGFRARPVFATPRGIRFRTRRGWRSVRWDDVEGIQRRGVFLRFDRFVTLRLVRGGRPQSIALFASPEIEQILADYAPDWVWLERDRILGDLPEKLQSALGRAEALLARLRRRAPGRAR